MKSERKKFEERKEKAVKILICLAAVMIVGSVFESIGGSQPEVAAMFDSTGIEETQKAAWFSHVEVSSYGSWPGYLEGKIEVKEGSPADYKIAVYILVGGGWWTKPSWASPWTEVEEDGNFSCLITTGGQDQLATKIAAFLVPKDYEIPEEELLRSGQQTLPEKLEEDAVDKTIIDRSPKLREIEFSGYTWLVKNSSDWEVGPGPNYFSDSDENVRVDDQGQLHLKITNRDGEWYCAEVISERSFGYGKYIFYLASRVDQLDKNVVLGLFTWDDTCPENRREIDIEFARWSVEEAENAQYVVQPWDHPGNRHRFNIQLNENYSTHSFDWESESLFFQSLYGHYISPPNESYIIESWNYTGEDIPEPGSENARINLWLFNGNPPSDDKEVEVIIKKFEFIPRLTSCDAAGNEKNQFAPGEIVYVKGSRLEPSKTYKIWIQDDPVNESDILISEENPSTAETPKDVTTDSNGNLSVTPIWSIPQDATVTYHEYDIVLDKQDDGENTGKYNAASDGIDSTSVVGFIAPIPELSTIILFSVGLIVLAGYAVLRRKDR